MTHAGPMKDSDGTFGKPEVDRSLCPKCGEVSMRCEPWESSCGGYVDYRYTCESQTCGHVRWVDGIDS